MNNIFKVIKFAKPYWFSLFLISVVIVLTTLLDLFSPYILKLIIDQIELGVINGGVSMNTLYWLIGAMLFVNVFAAILEALNQRLGDFTTARIGRYLIEKFYRKIFTLPQHYFDTNLSGKIINQLNRGILSLEDFLGASTNFILPSLIRTIFIIVVLSFYNIAIALLTLLIFPFYVYVSHVATKKWGVFQEQKNLIDDTFKGRIQEVIANIKLVKGYNSQKREFDFTSENLKKSVLIYDKQSKTYHIYNFLRNFGLEVGMILIALIVFRETFLGIMSIGEMVLILQYLNQIRRPLFAMSFIIERIKQAETGSKEYFDILALESTEKFSDERVGPLLISPEIRIKNMSFEYPENGAVLKNINVTFAHGETVALVGHSGAGKTTLISLICKLYEPTKGEIYLNNSSYNSLAHSFVRSHISLVFQENELFSTTVFENVAYAKKNATEKEVIEALKKANASEFVSEFKNGIYEQIGERGVRLSGGQKQRLQIARAILADLPILILDEATSSLDAKSEKLVQDALGHLMKNRLTIIIAHRFSTIQNADKIIVLNKGEVVDFGTPQELSKREGVYSELLRYQIEGNQKLLEQYEIS
jgi:ATP-binding cassette subfamily B protein